MYIVYNGRIVGDDKLEEFELELNKNDNKEESGVVYGGIKSLNKDQENILLLPPKHKTFPKLNIESFETELEKCIIKAKWEKIRNETAKETKKKNIECDNEVGKDLPNDVFNDEKKVIDFRNLRSTELKNNKRIVIPDLDDDEEEVRKNTLKKDKKIVINLETY